jgi:arylsulfatase A-like enzyme
MLRRVTARSSLLAWPGAWLLVGVVASIVGLIRRSTSGTFGVRALGSLVSLGQYLAIGLCALALALAWQRMPDRVQRFRLAALALVALVVAWFVLREDFSNLGEGAVGSGLRFAALLVAASTIPIASGVTRRIASRRLVWLGILPALALVVANGVILPRLYAGVHLWVAWLAATVIAELLAARLAPRTPDASGHVEAKRAPPWRALVIGGVLASLAAAALVVRPNARVQVALLGQPGAVFAPFVLRVRASIQGDYSSQFKSGEWFEPRSGPPIPATRPPVLPNDAIVLLLTLDAFRADALSNPENAARFPVLSRLRDRGVYFTQARSPSSQTAASLAAIFTGRFYSQLRWGMHPRVATPAKTFAHEDKRPRFPELLRDAGVRTFTSASSDTLLNEFGLARGFQDEKRGIRNATLHARAITARLEQLRPGERLFAYAHFMEPHEPYVSGRREDPPFQRYLSEIAVVDREIGRILEFIEKKGWTARTTLIISGDHGEAFGEHNTYFHATTLYEELLRVPLVVFSPSLQPRRYDELVTLADLGPTILDLMGLATPASFLGQSLVPILLGKPARLTRPIVAESGRTLRAFYFPDGKKLIVDPRTATSELYDLTRDPGELDNLYDPERDVPRMAELLGYFGAHTYRAKGYKMPYRP